MKTHLQRNIFLLGIFSFFQYFAFWQPIKQLYLYSIGADEAALGIGIAIWTISQFVFEMPSGYVSDRFGKKRALYIGQIARLAAFITIVAIPTVPSYYFGLFLLGVSAAFVSGTDKALLYDTLVDLKREKEYTKLSGRMNGLAIVGLTLSGFIALPIASLGYDYSYLLSIVPQIFVVGAIIFMYVPKRHVSELLHNPARDMLTAIKQAMGTRTLQLLVLLAATMQLVKQVNMDFGQAFLYAFISSAATVSFLWVMGGVARSISNFIAHYISKYRWTLVFLTFVLFLGMTFGPHWLAPWLYVLMLLPASVVIIEAEEAVQKAASSHLRATTLSGMNMFITLVETIPIIALGWLMSTRGPIYGFQVASVVLALFAFGVYLVTLLYRRQMPWAKI